MFDDVDLVGGENLNEVLTGLQAKPPKRGRPFAIEDWELSHRREGILGALEFDWSEVGWELQNARTMAAIRNALKPIPEPRDRYFELFLTGDTERTTAPELHEQHRVLKGLKLARRELYTQQQEAQERLERAEAAVRDVGSDERLLRFREERKQQFLKAQQAYRELNARVEDLQASLIKQSAYIAQSELLDFIHSKRYKLSPLSFADAMAGLPEISWRVSMKRCRNRKISHQYPFQYALFLEVARSLAKHPRSANLAIEQVKEHLMGHKVRNRSCVEELRKQWHFLRSALETVYTANPRLPRGAGPYRVFAEYMRRTTCISRVDQVLAEELRLNSEV